MGNRFNKQMMPRLQSSSVKSSMLSLSGISTRQALPAITSYRKFCTSGKDANDDPAKAKAKLDEGVNKSKHHEWSPEVATESEMAVKGFRGESDASDSTRQDSKDMKEGKIGHNTDKKARQASGATQDTRRSYSTTIELEPEQIKRQKSRGGSDPTVDELHDDKFTRKLHDERMTESRRSFATMTDSEYEKQQREKAEKATEGEMISEMEDKGSLSGSQRSAASHFRRNSSDLKQQQKRSFTSSAKSDNMNKPNSNPFRPAPAAGDADTMPKKSPTEINSENAATQQRRSYSTSDATTKAGMSFTNAEDEPKRKPTPKFGRLPEQSASQLSGTYSEADATVHASKKVDGQAAFKDRTKADTRTNTAPRSYPTGKV